MGKPVVHYFTKARHSSTLHYVEGFKRAACMPGRDLDQDRAHLLELPEAEAAYTAGAKVCAKCFPNGLRQPLQLLADSFQVEPPQRAHRPLADWIGEEAMAGRFYGSLGEATAAYRNKYLKNC